MVNLEMTLKIRLEKNFVIPSETVSLTVDNASFSKMDSADIDVDAGTSKTPEDDIGLCQNACLGVSKTPGLRKEDQTVVM